MMLHQPKSPLRATYHGPQGTDRVNASVIHDGGRRWRIGTPHTAHLDDGVSAYSITGRHVVATRSGGMASFAFLKAMVLPKLFADLDGRLPLEATATLAGLTSVDGRSCWELSVEPQGQRWLIDQAEGHVLLIEDGEEAIRLERLEAVPTLDAELFRWNGHVDEDHRLA